MTAVKKSCSFLLFVVLLLSSLMVNVSAASVNWTPRYDTLKSAIAAANDTPRTQSFVVKGKNNKKLYIQMHVGYDNSLSGVAKGVGYSSASNYYDAIKNKTRFDITVKNAKGVTVAQYKNVKYGHVTVFNCSNQNYTVTVKSYFSSYNHAYGTDRAASFYAQWSASYYYQ